MVVTSNLQITQKGGIYVDNIGWILNILFLVPLPRGVHSLMAMLLNLAKSGHYYHHLVITN